MKLSQVCQAKELSDKRRQLVVAYVDVGVAAGIYPPYGFTHVKETVFGYTVDEPMTEALRKAAREEILCRVEQCDAELARLGVEVDGIEIELKREEASRHPKEVAA